MLHALRVKRWATLGFVVMAAVAAAPTPATRAAALRHPVGPTTGPTYDARSRCTNLPDLALSGLGRPTTLALGCMSIVVLLVSKCRIGRAFMARR